MIMYSILDYSVCTELSDELLAALPERERERIERTGNAELRTARVFVYSLLYALLTRPDSTSLSQVCTREVIAPSELVELTRKGARMAPPLLRSENGKPYFESEVSARTPSNIRFSISHSENFVAAVIADMPVGIDIQQHIEVDEEGICEHFSMPKGNFWLEWTCREATAKMYDSEFAKVGLLKQITSFYTDKDTDAKGNTYTLAIAL